MLIPAYKHGQKSKVQKLYSRFQEIGYQILEDIGEFGGGPLTYQLVELAKRLGDITVLEITLSHQFAEDEESVANILESFTVL